jgi:hypothetical protein
LNALVFIYVATETSQHVQTAGDRQKHVVGSLGPRPKSKSFDLAWAEGDTTGIDTKKNSQL